MKGLIIKDLMCMRKNLIIFCYVVISVLVISVMFVLSAQFGNIAIENAEMLAENSMSEIEVNNLSILVLIAFMLLPVAVIGDFSIIFKEDHKAGFAKISASLPLSIAQRVMAKYITVLLLFGIGTVIDVLIALVLSRLTDIISFADFLGIIISAASVMSIYSALVIVFCFLFKGGSEEYASICALLSMGGIVFLMNWSKIKMMFQNIVVADGDGHDPMLDAYVDFFKTKSYLLLLAAAVVWVISYFASVAIAKRKRGVV